MIEFEINCDKDMLKQVEKALGDLHKKAPKVISTAANKTAIEARKLLASMAHQKYSVKKKYVKFRKEMRIVKAKETKPTAIIKAVGKPIELYKFTVRPKTFNPKRKKPPKGKVLSASSMKSLQSGDLKAFIVRFSNGHLTVAQRTGKIKAGATSRFTEQCKILFSPSIPSMVGSEENVYGPLKIQIKEIYRQQCLLEINKIINESGDS